MPHLSRRISTGWFKPGKEIFSVGAFAALSSEPSSGVTTNQEREHRIMPGNLLHKSRARKNTSLKYIMSCGTVRLGAWERCRCYSCECGANNAAGQDRNT